MLSLITMISLNITMWQDALTGGTELKFPWAHHLWEKLMGVWCAATMVAVTVGGLHGTDLGGRCWLWGRGTSHLVTSARDCAGGVALSIRSGEAHRGGLLLLSVRMHLNSWVFSLLGVLFGAPLGDFKGTGVTSLILTQAVVCYWNSVPVPGLHKDVQVYVAP